MIWGSRGKWAGNGPIPGRQLSPREKPGKTQVGALSPCSPGVSQGESWIPGKTLGFTRETLPAENKPKPTKTLGFTW